MRQVRLISQRLQAEEVVEMGQEKEVAGMGLERGEGVVDQGMDQAISVKGL